LAPALALAGLGQGAQAVVPTFPSRMPLVQLDYIYARGLQSRQSFTPHGPAWGRFSDHLPLITDFAWPVACAAVPSRSEFAETTHESAS
jgi:endonuclease/exonuclease/phosphatase family metal-dependent hydrolase